MCKPITYTVVLALISLVIFGFSDEYLCVDFYVIFQGLLPVKWMAPEAMFDGKYDTKSDV